MKEGPDIARIASLIGDPARANMLTALMVGKALTATELAQEAGVTMQTASAHLAKLDDGGLICSRKQGRHKYFTLATPGVAYLLETMMGLAAGQGHLRTRTGPRNDALRAARICYNHLAGEAGIQLYDSLLARDFLGIDDCGLGLTGKGQVFMTEFGINLEGLKSSRAPLCRECLDWSARRSHLAGTLGRALLSHMQQLSWLNLESGSRVVTFTKSGHANFCAAFPRG
tara:strand:+ start:3272 stop:3955 length:684 start_codon:yes stop_codon:yes gene_type:complete